MPSNGTSRRIRRVLVANRGEIAVRVMRTCKELGIETVAVYSDADRSAVHVRTADRAFHLGPSPARESYLDIEKVIHACRVQGADAVHPGYGFLSENEDFAEACQAAGITFIGPSADAMRKMGDKTTARATVMEAGVPVVPGDNGPEGRGFPTVDAALASARGIGFPVMLKASAGGGGKGMRLVESEAKFTSAYDGAKREAKAAFGDDAVYIEKAIIRPRHVEVQVFGDVFGNTIHLGERDCSIQRRHQKVIEESPSPAVTPELRASMGEIAVKAAKAVNYRGAGTVEFLLAADGSYYFLEMNTRLQVEHPVTEMVYGLDLVAWQIAVAEGKPLPLTQEQADGRRRGAAIECRVYAEDPIRFFPAPGKITSLRVPSGPYVRDDSGVQVGSEISVFYDPLISKLVAWGEDRDQALKRMIRALGEYRVGGTLKTNLPFHRRILRHPLFLQGEFDTGFIDREKDTLLAPHVLSGEELDVAVIAATLQASNASSGLSPSTGSASTSSPAHTQASTSTTLSAWRLSLGNLR
ncbi:MAG: acetyl-CoA carboxylase biotin carboxylase subunit [Deltaproteobacteria bacterium]|nr:acetyl-CoA carboxylase biotin carboxylase subunit [Deltaproteobacteria bacterium]